MSADSFQSMRSSGRKSHDSKVRGFAGGGGVKSMVRKGIREHENQEHGGKHSRLKLKTGGSAEGEAAAPRLDRATGGRGAKAKSAGKKGKGGNNVNVIVAGHGAGGPPPGGGMPPGGPMMAPKPPMPPPMAPPGAPPPGGPPMMPPPKPPMAGPPPVGAGVPPMRASGGRAYKRGGVIDDGARSGPGRLEKIEAYGKKTGGDPENKAFTGGDENKAVAEKAPDNKGGL